VSPLQRLLRPLTGRLLDGRFADVNRRLGDVGSAVTEQAELLDKLAGDLSAHTATQTEALGYIGVGLRRMEEAFDAHSTELRERDRRILDALDRQGEEWYALRLDDATRRSLAQLDAPLARAINYAQGHRGFAAQAGLWFNPPVTVELEEAAARIADVNERIVELPFAAGMLASLPAGARILDLGGAESTFALSAASLGYDVTAIDPQGLPFAHPNLTAVRRRLEDWTNRPSEPFAGVFLISAIEHFGLGAYGETPAGLDADAGALQIVRELIAPDGLLVITTPYGEASVSTIERVYDDAGLDRLLAGWEIEERRIIARADDGTWSPGATGTAATALIAARPQPGS
jgi:SAM-dependent methyltransferase